MYEPKNLDEFIGQKQAVNQVKRALAASTARKRPFPHLLLAGPPGTGKTTLAKLVAEETGSKLIMATPAVLKDNEDLFNLFFHSFNDESEEDEGIVIFMDEIHRLPVKVEEDFYIPMENNKFIRRGINNPRYTLTPWTLIGATTLPGKISEPLRDRFGLKVFFGTYTEEEMKILVSQAAEKSDVILDKGALAAIVRRSRNNPRIANQLLDRCADGAAIENSKRITEKLALEEFEIQGVDSEGLLDMDRNYLLQLYKVNRQVGVQSLLPILHLDIDTITNEIEPYLVEQGLIVLSARGRQLTQRGLAYVEKAMKDMLVSKHSKSNKMRVEGGE